MKTVIQFSGLSFEVGQFKSGLVNSGIRARGYFNYLFEQGIEMLDHGDIAIPNRNEKIKVYSESDLPKIEWGKYHDAFLKTRRLMDSPLPILNWGGDHSIAIATCGAFIDQNPEGYILWIDAHADLNLPEYSLSGNIHGMPLAILLNLNGICAKHFKWITKFLNPKKLIYIGLRDIDPYELSVIESLEIKAFHYRDVQKFGMSVIAKKILEITKGNPIHVSFDIDSVDPVFAPSTGVPVKLGLTPNDLDILGEELLKKSEVRSLDIVEVNPELGNQAQVDRTYSIAFSFLRSVFKNNYQGDHHDGINERNSREQFTNS